MQSTQISFSQWLEARRGLWWSVADVSQLSEESILEGIVSYGEWDDFLELKKRWGLYKISQLFESITAKKRVNLRPATRSLFANYLARYA